MARAIGGSPKDGNIIALGNPTFSSSSYGYAPTPTISTVKALKRHHRVELVDEYLTSQQCSRCFMKLQKTKHTIMIFNPDTEEFNPTRVNNFRVLHCSNCHIYWNRDVNSANNMRTIAIQLLTRGVRPAAFSRPRKYILLFSTRFSIILFFLSSLTLKRLSALILETTHATSFGKPSRVLQFDIASMRCLFENSHGPLASL
jgi:hypothetical protein